MNPLESDALDARIHRLQLTDADRTINAHITEHDRQLEASIAAYRQGRQLMAITSLKNVEVTRLNRSGYGFGVKEQNESNGKTYTTYWTVGRRKTPACRLATW